MDAPDCSIKTERIAGGTCCNGGLDLEVNAQRIPMHKPEPEQRSM